MPYTVDNPPDAIKGLPEHAIEIWVSAYNSAFEQYDGDEAKSAGTAWAAVKMKYKQVDGNWVAKESKEAKMATKLSNKKKEQLLQTALVTEYKIGVVSPIPKSLVIEEVFDGEVIYNIDGQLYKSTYELDENGTPTFGEPQKVSSAKVFSAMESLSMENRRTMLNTALATHLTLGENEYVYVEDMTETEVYYNHDQQAYKAPYSIAGDETITIGDSVKVVRQTTYKTLESLQSTYSEIIQEAGKRNAARDAGRVKKILELCQELLSSEAEPDEKDIQKATKEASAVLVWLKTQEAVKAEEGNDYPQAAFAYAPNSHKPGTWQLRMWEDLDKKVTKTQLGRVAASLSPGGLRGQKATIPSKELAAVKRKIRAEYRRLKVAEEDIPKWVKETMTREYPFSYEPLTEATFDKGRATVIVIKAGFNADKSRYYPAEMLKRDFEIFEGLKMYADHPTETEAKEIPERSIKPGGWVATLKDVTCDENGTITGVADIIEDWLMKKLATLRDKAMLSEMGISINAVGHASKATIEGVETLVIEELTGAESVDFVTEPGAHGAVTLYEADRSHNIDLVELSGLKERRPDLVKIIEANVRAEITEEVKKSMENEELIKEKDDQIATLTKERDSLKEAAEKAEKDKAKAEAQATIKEAVDKAELPDAAKEVILKRFENAESADGIAEAIQSEIDYIAKLSEAGKVKGLGPSEADTKKDKEALKESFKKGYLAEGKPEEEAEKLAEIAAAGR